MTRQKRTPEEAARHILQTLRDAGHVALFAGGCVRDRLLSRPAKDYDVATDAPPQRVEALFPRARRVGAKFGVMLVRKYGIDVEVATFRTEGDYTDGRRPETVRFTTPEEDARRRDFTINGLFYDPIDDRVIDFVGGRADLQAGIVRTIGDPHERFAEDHLRMLRAVRFAARFEFAIEPDTLDAIRRLADHLRTISAERIWMELEWMLTDPSRARAWELLQQTDLRAHLSPDWPVAPDQDRLAHRRLSALPAEPVDAPLALAAVICERPPDEVRAICRSLRLSNRLTRTTVWLVRSLPLAATPDALELADLKTLMAGPAWDDLLALLRADLSARGAPMDAHRRLLDRAASIAPESVSPPPLLTGDDLHAMGFKPGPRFGRLLAHLYRMQLNDQLRTRDEAVRIAREWLSAESQD